MTLRQLLPALALTLGLAACRDSVTAPIDLAELVPANGTQVVLQQQPGSEPGTVTFVVRVITRRADLGSYQGELTFASGSLDLLGAETLSGLDGEMRIVNPQPENGSIRFAAFATESFASDEAFRFTVRPRGDLASMRLRASLGVAGVLGGAAIEAAQLREADGVRDAQGRLVSR